MARAGDEGLSRLSQSKPFIRISRPSTHSAIEPKIPRSRYLSGRPFILGPTIHGKDLALFGLLNVQYDTLDGNGIKTATNTTDRSMMPATNVRNCQPL